MPTVALVSRDRLAGAARFAPVLSALEALGLEARHCFYDEDHETEVEALLTRCDAVQVWVNPIQDGRTRRGLDAVLRRVAASGVKVSAHPDIIDRLGCKRVLAATASLGWSGDSVAYDTPEQLWGEVPRRLAKGARVLKRNRGSSGDGVWKLETLAGGKVCVTAAAGDRTAKVMALDDFLAMRAADFVAGEGYVDQAFQDRLEDGMVRCYMSADRLVGFGWQKVRALLDDQPAPARTYSGPEDPRFQHLRSQMESAWTPRLLRLFGLEVDDLPALWDADLLFGPRDAAGADTFVLCEINMSSVHPMPLEAPAQIARTIAQRLGHAR